MPANLDSLWTKVGSPTAVSLYLEDLPLSQLPLRIPPPSQQLSSQGRRLAGLIYRPAQAGLILIAINPTRILRLFPA